MFKIEKKEQPTVEMFEGVTRTTLAGGKDLLMARFSYKKGSKVPPHQHSFEQVTTLLEGEQKIIIYSGENNEELIVKSGDSYVVPSTFKHEQISLKDTVTIDVWCLAP
jgi:quercetin dioxygenase-like cupin family protein